MPDCDFTAGIISGGDEHGMKGASESGLNRCFFSRLVMPLTNGLYIQQRLLDSPSIWAFVSGFGPTHISYQAGPGVGATVGVDGAVCPVF